MIHRVLTGMRTTGVLHLGHYVGALKAWLDYQNNTEMDYDNYFLLADFQALSTHADRPEVLTQAIRDVVLDWLSVGLDPTLPNVHFVQQSQIPERYELSMMFQMVARYKDIMDIPTLKVELRQLEDQRKNPTVGFITYPVDQAADVFMVTPQPLGPYDKIYVPVGSDQNSILERGNVIARSFNSMYNCKIFTPCTIHEGVLGRLPGTGDPSKPEGGKMGKSLGNTINLSDDPATVRGKVMEMYTDEEHKNIGDAGDTFTNPTFVYHRAFNDNKAEVADLTERYKTPGVRCGDVEVKEKLAVAINRFLDPIREKRARCESADIRGMVVEGTRRARELCIPVVEAARDAMHLKLPA